ncbi:cryptic plasmid protein A [Accumulibacter sp.]|uniref:cryptic plasmid protein A n=1 Tax=Accumulibacter sp. TaxID=2053492 RepID=UPI00262AECDA|nr:cryptic plasmid protein A [Accumulibacter sp.]
MVLNPRDERAIAWMIEQVGFAAVQEACGRLAGGRRLYPTNLAKALGLTIPDSVVATPASAALERIRELRCQFPWLGQ